MTTSELTEPHLTPAPTGPFLTESDLAARWQVARGSLANLRSDGRSPVPYVKILGRVRYPLSAVVAYEAQLAAAA